MLFSLSKRMKKVLAKFLVLAMAFTAVFGSYVPLRTVSAEGLNIVKNPGFEEGATTPDYWVACTGFENLMVLDSTTFYSGQRSLKLSTSASDKRSIYDQKGISVNAGSKYNLEAYCKVSGFNGSGLVDVYFYDKDGKSLGHAYATVSNTSEGWQKIEKTDIIAPATSKTAMIRLMILGDKSTGDRSVWYDDIRLTEVAVPQRTLASVSAAVGKDTLLAGQTTQVSITAKWDTGEDVDLTASGAAISYTSGDEQIATIDSTGLITAVSPGTCDIISSVKIGEVTKEGSVAITVSDKTLDVVTVTPGKTTLYAGESTSLIVSAALSDGTGVDMKDAVVSYSSSNTEAAAVDSAGMVTALNAGTTTITAEVALGNAKKTGSIEIQINEPILDSVKISCMQTEILPEQTIQLSVTGSMTNGEADLSKAVISYSSDNPEVAAVDGNGLVTGIKPGVAKVMASVTLDEVTKQAEVVITVSQQIQEETIIYDFHKLGLETKYINAGTFQETQEGWEVSDASCNYIAQPFGISVQSEGMGKYINLKFYAPQTSAYLVKFMGTQSRSGGTAGVIIDGQKVGEYCFSADSKIDGPKLDLGYIRLEQGMHQLTLKVIAKGTMGSKWYYMYPTEFIVEKVLCIPVLSEVSISADKTELIAGQTAKLTVSGMMNTGDPADLSGQNASISYISDNEAAATVSSAGIVTPVSAGTAKITVRVTLGNITKETTVSIVVLAESLASVNLTAASTEIPVESKVQLTLTGNRTDGHDVDLSEAAKSFKSSDSTIATVDQNGLVSALMTGSVTISAEVTLGSATCSASIAINIVEPVLASIKVESDKTQVVIGRTAKLSVTGTLNNGKPADMTAEGTSISYKSDNDAVATVSSDGIVTAVDEGTSVITAEAVSGSIKKEAEISISVINPANIVNAKKRATYYTDAKVAAARENVQKYDWAKALKDKAVVEADQYLELGDEYLWSMVTPQSIPRTMFHIQRTKAGVLGCPVCGKDITTFGSYPWKLDPVNDPWKLVCPSCSTKFPTNDFEAYYKTGLDEHGIFNPDLADKSLLKNTLYPEKGETWGVDDGYGWKNGNDVWTFVAYYNHWALWYQSGIIQKAVKAFRDAYIFTGDVKYAHAGIILLDRIADVYPDMDITEYLWDEGFDNGVPSWHTCQGKVLNDIWETFIVTDFASAYDAFFPALKDGDAANVVPFLSQKADQYGLGVLKYSNNGIKKNIEDNILRQVLPAFKNSQIRGNQGMHQATLAMAAVVLDEEGTTQEMLDYNFKSGGLESINGPQYPNGRKYIVTGGNILALLVNDVDRDGAGNEASPGYNDLWISQMMTVADVLDGYDRYPEADLYKNVKFRKMFQSHYPLIMDSNYIPSIGDSGGTGLPGISLKADMFVKAFEKFNDPVYAQVAYMLNGKSTYGIHSNVFSANPEKVAEDIKSVIDAKGPLDLGCNNMTGYGLATLRDGRDYTMKVGYTFNFLEMSIAETSGKEYKEVSFPALFYRSAGAGDYITFAFTVPEADEYSIGIQTLNAALYGKYIVKLDGTQIGEEFDAYGPAVVEADVLSLGKMNLTAGEHRITLECTGKNDSSTNYVIGLRKLILLNKDAEEAEKINEQYGNQQRDVWVYYGRNTGHGHKDTLNLGMHAFGLNLAPDLGYPEYTGADPKRLQWTSNTISHNTVVVDKGKQQDSWIGIPNHFDSTDMVSLMDTEAPRVYPQTEMYRRTTAMIKVDDANSYAVDFFRVEGGNEHHFSFHSNEAAVTTDGLNLTAQGTGTYAGSDVPFAQRPADDSVDGTYYMGSGFHYLYNVEKDDNPADSFSIDWQQTKDPQVHLKLTMLGELDDVAIADGEPPLNNQSNPRKLKYMIAHRSGQNLDSTFTSVLEPYKGERYIESITAVNIKADGQLVDDDSVRAVKVVLKNGRTDYIIYSLDGDATYTVDDKFQFKGFFGVYSEKDGKQISGYVNDGSVIGWKVKGEQARLTGKVVDFTGDMNVNNEITVQMDSGSFTDKDLVGRYIYVNNDGIRNAAYKIKSIKDRRGYLVTLNIGDATLIRKWLDSNDFSKGFEYDIAKNAGFVIPLSYTKPVSDDNGDSGSGDNGAGVQDEIQKLIDETTKDLNSIINSTDKHIDKDKKVTDAVETAIRKAAAVEVPADRLTVNGACAAADIDNAILQKAVENAVKVADILQKTVKESSINIKPQIVVDIDIQPVEGIKQVTAKMPVDILSAAERNGIDRIAINTGTGTVAIKPDALNNSITKGANTFEISIAAVDKSTLSEDMAQKVGNSQVYDFNAYVDGKQVSKFTGKKSVEITLDYTLKEGENPDKIVVYYINDKGELEAVKNCRYDAAAHKVTFTTNHFSKYTVKETGVTFSDMGKAEWAKVYVEALAGRGIIKGVDIASFEPNRNITRAEFAKLLVEAFDLLDDTAEAKFSDVTYDKWYYTYVASAYKAGIINGAGNNWFAPDEVITRQDMAAMAYRAVEAVQAKLAVSSAEERFDDAGKIAGYANNAILALQQACIIEGTGNGKFEPEANATRAAAVKIVYLLFKKL